MIMAAWSNLGLQLITLACLVLGVVIVKNAKIKFHSLAMLVAVVLNAISILYVMLPSAIRILVRASVNSFTFTVALHSILGIVAEILGIYFVWKWRFRKPRESCFNFRSQMKIVNFIWVGMFIVGIIIFNQLYM
jgi:uncharacterized membrane protein YozB (DUF420 family)